MSCNICWTSEDCGSVIAMAPDPRIESLKKRLRSAAVELSPRPWRRVQTFAVGGLLEVGFAPDSDLLLVVSAQGRSVIGRFTKLAVEHSPRAFGFSETGASLVLATSSDLTIFGLQ